MALSTPFFIFLFLPIVLAGYYLVGRRAKNVFLLLASLFFYAWGEPSYLWLLILSIVLNYAFGVLVDKFRKPIASGLIIGSTVAVNLGLLVCLKYPAISIALSNQILGRLGFPPIQPQSVHLPIGMSFFTFQAIAYVIDVYRQESRVQKNPFSFALFMSLFPKLTAGPIIRYREVESDLDRRSVKLDDLAYGIKRLVVGLGKKVLIANTLARTTAQIFAIPSNELTTGLAWLGIVGYTLQIYFDFAGYTDMAIGLGRMFGFRFAENFNYPYVSRSITEFWRRWHISLSSWLRDYLFLPLTYALMTDKVRGKIAQGKYRVPYRMFFSLFVTFTLCGVWHGSTLNFVAWGMFHGFLLVVERAKLDELLKKAWVPLRHLYALSAIVISWVFFRIESFADALGFLRTMFGLSTGSGIVYCVDRYLDTELLLAIICGIIFAMPLSQRLKGYIDNVDVSKSIGRLAVQVAPMAELAGLGLILVLSAMSLAGSTYCPFIYYRF